MIYIFWSCATKEEAVPIIEQLLEKRFIACASIIPGIESFYQWQGAIKTSQEVKVIMKTGEIHFDAIVHYIKTHGSYEIPEIVQLDVTNSNPAYLDWVTESTSCVST